MVRGGETEGREDKEEGRGVDVDKGMLREKKGLGRERW